METKDMKNSSNKPIVVITAICGNYDYLKVMPEQSIPVDFICFTDSKEQLVEKGAYETRTEVCVADDPFFKDYTPRMAGKRFRMNPFRAVDMVREDKKLKYGDIVIWMDGTGRLLNPNAIENLLTQCPKDFDVCCFKHPERSSIYEEASFCVDNNLKKYKDRDLMAQVNHYEQEGFYDDVGLSATGLLIMKYTPEMEELLEERRDENIQRGPMDQLSRPYLVWKHDVDLYWLDDNLRYNENIDFKNHHTSDD